MYLPAANVVATRMSERAMSDSVNENILQWKGLTVCTDGDVLLFARGSMHTSSCASFF